MKAISKTTRPTTTLRVGFYHELTDDIGPIPRGIYRLDAMQDDTLVFRAGRGVSFIISGCWTEKVRSIPQSRALVRRTTQCGFLDRYYERLNDKQLQSEPFDVTKPLTACIIDPAVAREIH